MKKAVSLILCVIMMFSVMSVSAFASDETVVSETVTYLDDGSYMVTVLTESENLLSRATSTKTGSKTTTLYNSDSEAVVQLKLTGTFSYTGSSASCTASSVSYTVYDSSWKVTSSTASKSGNKAIGDFVSKHYVLLIPVQTIETTITITCSNSGTLS